MASISFSVFISISLSPLGRVMIMRRFDKKDMGEIYKNKHFCWNYSQYTNMCSFFMCVLYHTKCVYASIKT